MKFGVVNKSTILNRFVLYTLQRNFTHLAIITRKTNIKLVILRGGNWKRAPEFNNVVHINHILSSQISNEIIENYHCIAEESIFKNPNKSIFNMLLNFDFLSSPPIQRTVF